jgi:hypothetical protein
LNKSEVDWKRVMLKRILASPVRSIIIVWVIFLPLSYILGWGTGYMFGSDAITGSDTGSGIGLFLGGAAGGVAVALALRRKYPEIGVKHVLVIMTGWAVALLTVGVLLYEFGRMID